MDHGPTEQFETPAPTAPARAAPAKRKRPVPAGILEEQPVNALEQTRPAKRLRKASKKRAAADEAAVAEGAAPPPKRQKGAEGTGGKRIKVTKTKAERQQVAGQRLLPLPADRLA